MDKRENVMIHSALDPTTFIVLLSVAKPKSHTELYRCLISPTENELEELANQHEEISNLFWKIIS